MLLLLTNAVEGTCTEEPSILCCGTEEAVPQRVDGLTCAVPRLGLRFIKNKKQET